MSCNLFSDLGGTNIRSHRWTKPSLRATATAYQKHWEPSKKAEISWFCRKAASNFFFEKPVLIWLFPSKNSSCQGLPPWREIQQPNSEILVESLQESSIRSFIIWNGTSQIISKNTKTPGPSKKTFSSIQNREILKKLDTNDPKHQFKLEFRETANIRKRNWNELQFVFISWWYEHQESQMVKIITTSNSNWVPKIMRVIKESWDWLVLTRGDTQLFMQGKLLRDLFTLTDSSLQGYTHWITIERFNSQSEIFVMGLQEYNTRSFII